MIKLFQMGGPLFMSLLTILLLAMVFSSIKYVSSDTKTDANRDLIKSIGLLAMIVGIFGQLIGLFSAFQAIEMTGTVSPAMLGGGLKVSMITTLYGILIYIISYLIWLFFRVKK